MVAESTPLSEQPSTDQRILLQNISWSHYETLMAIRGDSPAVRVAYLNGEMELMTPSKDHETLKKTLARLIEAYGEEVGVDLIGYGSWTVRNAPAAAGVEPDECYVVGVHDTDVPDIAIEVGWTSWTLNKLEIYQRLGVREVWVWRDQQLEIYGLGEGGYQRLDKSDLLPQLDVGLLTRFVMHPNQAQAVREFRRVLRSTL